MLALLRGHAALGLFRLGRGWLGVVACGGGRYPLRLQLLGVPSKALTSVGAWMPGTLALSLYCQSKYLSQPGGSVGSVE